MDKKQSDPTLLTEFHHELPTLPDSGATLWIEWIIDGFFHHGVKLLLFIMLFFVSVPFLTPLFMELGWTGPAKLIYQMYALFCHQLPQRSWFLFGEKLTYTLDEIRQVYPYDSVWQLRAFGGTSEMGWKVAWSDRMISFYSMIPVFGLVYLLPQFRLSKPITVRLLLLTLLPLCIDGFTHTLNDAFSGVSGSGFRDSNAWLVFLTNGLFPGFYAGDALGTFNWWLRLLTGLLAAWGTATFIFPWLNRAFHEQGHAIMPVQR